jgi:hypothetical protein
MNTSQFIDAGRITTQLGTPRGRYDEHSSKSLPQQETEVYRTSRKKAKLQKMMPASFATASDNL